LLESGKTLSCECLCRQPVYMGDFWLVDETNKYIYLMASLSKPGGSKVTTGTGCSDSNLIQSTCNQQPCWGFWLTAIDSVGQHRHQ